MIGLAKGLHEPLITEELFYDVQDIMGERKIRSQDILMRRTSITGIFIGQNTQQIIN